jgi:hypothetical protein
MLELLDEDGDRLRVKEIFAFGRPRVTVRINQEGDEAGVNLDVAQAKKLAEWLTDFAARCELAS